MNPPFNNYNIQQNPMNIPPNFANGMPFNNAPPNPNMNFVPIQQNLMPPMMYPNNPNMMQPSNIRMPPQNPNIMMPPLLPNCFPPPGGNFMPAPFPGNPGNIPANTGIQQFNGVPTAKQIFKQVYQNKKWTFTQNPNMKSNYLQKKQEFQNILNSSQNNSNACFQFKLSEERQLFIRKLDFSEFQVIGIINDSIDLSIIHKITNSYQGAEDALFYCFYPYIELDENLETTRFLLACTLLNLEDPFQDLQYYFKSLQQNPLPQDAHILKNGDDIIELYLFQDLCQKNDEFKQYINICFGNSEPAHPLNQYLKLLLQQNQRYFYNQGSGFNQNITRLEEQTFVDNVVQYFIFQMADNGRNEKQLIGIQQVDLVYKFLEFYYFTSGQFGNPKENIDKVFATFYNEYESRLSEEDKIEALKYQKSNVDNFIKQLKNQYKQIQEYKTREKALLNVILSLKTKNISMEAYRDQFKNMKHLIGEDLQKDIDQQIEEEIQKINSQQLYQYQNN
ncbi:hypothetical protein ABPG72_011784 [Tetrahymena utriculariae]